MSIQPLVSVIIPTYNRAGVICRTIDDVFYQTYKDFEVIVVDDGSTDDTQAVLQRYGNRIRVIAQDNAGPGASRNRGIEISRGEIIAFQDSDDFWAPTKLERQVRLLERGGVSVPCCLCNVLMRNLFRDGKDHHSFELAMLRPPYEEGLWLNVVEVLATRSILFNQAAAIRRGPLERLGGFDPNLRFLEDYDLSLRLAFGGPWAYIADPLAIWAGGGTDSLFRMAANDAAVLSECEIRTFDRALYMAQEKGESGVKRRLSRRLASSRRSGRLLEAVASPSALLRILGRLRAVLNRYWSAVHRRSPCFPRMETQKVEQFDSNQHSGRREAQRGS